MIKLIIFGIIILTALVLPGKLLLILINREDYDIPPFVFAISMTLLAVPIVIGYLLRLPLAYLLYPIILTICLLSYLAFKKKRIPQIIEQAKRMDKKKISFLILLLGIAYIFVFTVFPLHNESDMPYHFAHIRHMVDNNLFLNEEAITLLPDQSNINPAYSYNIWYGVSAMLSRLSNLDIITIFKITNPILLFLSVAAVAFLAKSLRSNRAFITFTVLSFVFLTVIFRPLDFMIMNFPNRIGYLIFLPLILGLYFQYYKDQKQKKLIYLIGALTATAGLIHNMTFFFVISIIGIFSLVRLFRNKQWKNDLLSNIKVFLSISAFSFPFILMKINGVISFSQFTKESGIPKGAITIFGNFYVYAINGVSLEIIISAILTLFFIIFYLVKKKPWPIWLYFFFSIFLLIILVRQNPIIAPLASNIVSPSYVRRILLVIPTSLIFGMFLAQYIAPKIGGKRTKALYFLLFIFLLIMPNNSTKKDYIHYIKASKRYDIIKPATKYINENVPRNSIIATDIGSGYFVPAYTDNKIIVTHDSHTSFYLSPDEQKERKNEDFKIFWESYNKGKSERERILKKYNANYILVARHYDFRDTGGLHYDGRWLIKEISKNNHYKLLYSDKDYNLYKINLN